jgi:hypothetical protein
VVLKSWLCGSVNLTANENKHHREERTSFFCCSARFRWSMHQPGYVQGGQEVGRNYLLLRIHVRRIRGIDNDDNNVDDDDDDNDDDDSTCVAWWKLATFSLTKKVSGTQMSLI